MSDEPTTALVPIEGEYIGPATIAETPATLRDVLLLQFSEAQVNFLLQRTPPHVIQKVSLRGGTFDYVSIGYVIQQLNLVFGFNWSFRVKDRWRDEECDECIVEGQLEVHTTKGEVIIKEQFGGSSVKRFKSGTMSGKPMSIADDYKGAASDALKKCATELGIGLDVGKNLPPIEYEVDPVQPGRGGNPAQGRRSPKNLPHEATDTETEGKIEAIFNAGRGAGMTDDDIEAQVAKMTNRKLFKDCNAGQQKAILDYFTRLPKKRR